jgi:hypothetical protein
LSDDMIAARPVPPDIVQASLTDRELLVTDSAAVPGQIGVLMCLEKPAAFDLADACRRMAERVRAVPAATPAAGRPRSPVAVRSRSMTTDSMSAATTGR